MKCKILKGALFIVLTVCMYVRKNVAEMNFKFEELETKASLATCNHNKKTFSDGFLVFYYQLCYYTYIFINEYYMKHYFYLIILAHYINVASILFAIAINFCYTYSSFKTIKSNESMIKKLIFLYSIEITSKICLQYNNYICKQYNVQHYNLKYFVFT